MTQFRTAVVLTLICGLSLLAQRAPRAKNEVARPGGKVPGSPKLALVKVADGFNDPTNVASPNDGSGRIFVVERVGRVRIVDRSGQVLPQPFLDLTKINPLGTDVQTGFVEQGLYSLAFIRTSGRTDSSTCITRRCRSMAMA
jgi:hypothetical protein